MSSLKLKDYTKFFFYLTIFCFPLKTAPGNLFFGLWFLCILIEMILDRKVLISTSFASKSMLAIFILFLFGLFWTDNMDNGLRIIKKYRFFLFFPFISCYIKRYDLMKVLKVFTASQILNVILSLLLYLKVFSFPAFFKPLEPEAYCFFIHHTAHGIFLSFALPFLIFNLNDIKDIKKCLFNSVLILLFLVSTLISKGRAGLGSCCISTLYSFFLLKNRLILFLLIFVLSILSIYTAFFTNYPTRIEEGFKEIKNFKNDYNTSMGLRLTFYKTSWELFKERKLLGFGTGDFEENFKEKYALFFPKSKWIKYNRAFNNPHNYYLQILVRSGLLGLILYISLLLNLFKENFKIRNRFKRVYGFVITTIFLFINLFENYSEWHIFIMFFVIFVSLIYDTEEKVYEFRKKSV